MNIVCSCDSAEILKRSPAVWPSSGRYLMYATFDDRRVGEYKYSVYMKDGWQQDAENDKKSKNHVQQQKPQRKKKRRRRRIRRDATSKPSTASETSEYYLYPKIRTIKYPKVRKTFFCFCFCQCLCDSKSPNNYNSYSLLSN